MNVGSVSPFIILHNIHYTNKQFYRLQVLEKEITFRLIPKVASDRA
jgi:hypothetical protein